MKISTALICFLFPLLANATARPVQTPPPTSPPLVATEIESLPDDRERLDLYLLIGQSNMKGRGFMSEPAQNNPDIVMMHLRNDAWYVARHPLHLTGDPETFEDHDNAGVGPGLTFAGAMLEADPAARIALIPAARGGSKIALWSERGSLYKEAVRRTKLALEAGPSGRTRLRAVLWLQGESDAEPALVEAYAGALHSLVDRLRADLGDPELPFIACTIGEMRDGEQAGLSAAINAILLDLPKNRAGTACVDARDLNGHIGDNLHFDTATAEEIGRRYAAALRKLEADSADSTPP